MSIQFPQKRQISDRKYHEAGVRGRFENNLRIIRGYYNSTTPTIIAGVGFTLTRNGTGDTTITFDPPFSAIPSVLAIAMNAGVNRAVSGFSQPTALSTRLIRFTGATVEDGEVSFVAVGPA